MSSTITEHQAEQAVAERGSADTPAKATRRAKKATGARGSKKAAKDAAPAKKRTKSAVASGMRSGSKSAEVIALLRRAKGATLDELMKATGWQAHSVRGFLSGTLGKKMGLKLTSEKPEDGLRVYSVVD